MLGSQSLNQQEIPMGSLGAFFSTDFDEISITIGHRLRASGRRTCLLVIVFVNAKTKIFRDHIGPYIGDWHYRSADSVEFVFPGFQGLGEPKDHGFRPQLFEDAYQDQIFVRATKAFEERSAWR